MVDDPGSLGGNAIEPRRAHTTKMFHEAAEAAEAVARQEASSADLKRIGAALRARSPHVVITCARGSSDHAATFAKYAIETRLRIPTASAAPSVASVYSSLLHAEGAVCIAISQSGRSPDLLAMVSSLKAAGAWVLALVNDTQSPLCELADEVFALAAGPERSVAATKSFITSLSAIARIVAAWSEDEALEAELHALPDQLAQAWNCDWSALSEALVPATSLYVLARGVGLAAAQEAALKLKETSQLHAEAFSTAELSHGPMALVREGFPLLMFTQDDETAAAVRTAAAGLAKRGARVFLAGDGAPGAVRLPAVPCPALLGPII